MDRSLSKFFNDTGGPEHGGGKLHWPGTPDGFPYRGDAAPTFKQHEIEDLKHVLDFHSGRFCMWLPEEKAAFDQIMDRISNSWYGLKKRFDQWIADERNYIIWLEWVQVYGEAVDSKHPGLRGQTNGVPAQDSELR